MDQQIYLLKALWEKVLLLEGVFPICNFKFCLTGDNPANVPYPHMQQPCWNSNKANQVKKNTSTTNHLMRI